VELCGIATQRTSSYESVMLHPTKGSRDATPCSDKEVPPNVATHYTREGIKGPKPLLVAMAGMNRRRSALALDTSRPSHAMRSVQ
jgi:hypothetical protein